MPIDILMPALSPSMEKGNLVQWVKRVGDSVRVGDILFEVETDKATMDVEAAVAGTLTSILVPQGTPDVAVNRAVGLIAAEGEAAEGREKAAKPVAIADPAAPANIALNGASHANGHAMTMTESLASRTQPSGADRLFASPIARRLMKEAGIDPLALEGSGPHGRILERDVIATIADRTARRTAPAPAVPPVSLPATPASDTVRRQFRAGSFDEVPHDGMRRTIACRLTEAKQTVPHFYLTADCRVDALLKLREEINRTASDTGLRLSVNDFLIKALARALVAVPDANVSFAEDAMLRHRHADISVAVSVEGGLVTPVIAEADTKSLSAISAEMKDLSSRARERRLRPEEYAGGTTGLSNLGMFGVRDFAAILNPPQATMLAVGAAEKRMIVVDDAPVVATMMTATLSVDHRAVDGAVGARLLSRFKALAESPMAILV